MVSRSNKGTSSTMALSCSQAKAWVKTHYERHEDGVVAKSVMYKHYEDYCREQGRNIMETSIFGRVVKSVFADVTIRRLGGRDNLKYYYCGIHVKETSRHAIDNELTMRPKRRLRKRELVTDKAEVHECLRWLHSNYNSSGESSIVKTDVYNGYVKYSKSRSAEPLSIQYFGMVVNHAFPNVTKRKLGPRTNQQKYYFGIQQRRSPVPLEMVSGLIEDFYALDEVFSSSRQCYREAPEVREDEEEEEEYNCRSPGSDMSDIASTSFQPHLGSYEPEMSTIPQLQEYFLEYLPEPVDYSLSSLRLKDEPPEVGLIVKEEPLDLHVNRDLPEFQEHPSTDSSPGPSNIYGTSPSSSYSNSNDRSSKKIYKPRFHYQEENSWNVDGESENRDEPVIGSLSSLDKYSEESKCLKNWLFHNFEEYKGVHLNRDQAYEFYAKFCNLASISPLPLICFDETMLKTFEGVTTMIHPTRKTFYEGIRVVNSSHHYGEIEEMMQEENDSSWDEAPSNSMELSPENDSNSSNFELEDEEEIPDENDPETYLQSTVEEEINCTPDVLRDGKFYLRNWLKDNFEPVPDSCVLKADAYKHYEIFAKAIYQTPFEMNVFGKIVRQVFPKVTIRRLGGRLKPQYHYCGIGVRSTSSLFQFMSGKDPAQRSRKKEIATDNRSAEVVIEYLKSNYQAGKDQIIMKSEVFAAYSSLCASIGENPVTLNYFGKLVKHCFPHVEVRKFGGRSEPTWYYYGLSPRSSCYGYPAVSFHEEKDIVSSSYNDHSIPHLANRGLSPLSPQMGRLGLSPQMQRTTSPIPIAIDPRTRVQLEPTASHSYDSPNVLQQNPTVSGLMRNSLFNQQARESFEDYGRVGSNGEGSFFREVRTTISPPDKRCHEQLRSPFEHSEVPLSRSPIDPVQNGLFVPNQQVEIIYNRDILPHPGIQQRLHRGGQVVPCQTPPTLMGVIVSDSNRPLIQPVHRSPNHHFVQQDVYEPIYNEIQME